MTDEYLIEQAQLLEDMHLQQKISEIQNKSGSADTHPIGECIDCGEVFPECDPLREKKKFCDSSCEAGWNEWYQAQIRKHGPGFKMSLPQVASRI